MSYELSKLTVLQNAKFEFHLTKGARLIFYDFY